MRRGVALAVFAAALAAVVATPAGAFSRRLVTTATDPVGIVAPASAAPGTLYVVQRNGRVRRWRNGTFHRFLDISGQIAAGGEQGLLGLAFHPGYDGVNIRRFYVYYTNRNGDIRVSQFRSTADGSRAMKGSQRVLVRIDHPDSFSNHNGGQLQFGPGGHLNIAVGDGGSSCDPWGHAQSLSSRMGKILDLNVDKADARARIRFYGLRNPWRFSFDRVTHDIWIADVGQSAREEIDFVGGTWPSKLRNFGWDVYEGRLRDTCPHGPLNTRGVLRFPIRTYSHASGRCSITGGYVYRGANVPNAVGRYFYGDFCTGQVWSFHRRSDGSLTRSRFAFNVPSLSTFGEDSAGELYLASLGGGIYKLRP